MAVLVGFSCGCVVKVPESKTGGNPPECLQHPHAHVARVTTRPPSLVGTAAGPHVKTQAMEPATPTLRDGAALTLKTTETKTERAHG